MGECEDGFVLIWINEFVCFLNGFRRQSEWISK